MKAMKNDKSFQEYLKKFREGFGGDWLRSTPNETLSLLVLHNAFLSGAIANLTRARDGE
jgi:hypothetical protein